MINQLEAFQLMKNSVEQKIKSNVSKLKLCVITADTGFFFLVFSQIKYIQERESSKQSNSKMALLSLKVSFWFLSTVTSGLLTGGFKHYEVADP